MVADKEGKDVFIVAKKAFILIDFSNDLIADEGVITCGKPAQAIAPVACAMMEEFLKNEDFVVVCNDVHPVDEKGRRDPYHPETELFGPHNLAGAWGSALYGGVKDKWQALSREYPFATVYFEKVRFSAFAGTQLDIWLRSRDVTEVVLGGVCTDMCVLHTAIDAYNRGYRIAIAAKATCSGSQEAYQFAIDHCKNLLGARIIE